MPSPHLESHRCERCHTTYVRSGPPVACVLCSSRGWREPWQGESTRFVLHPPDGPPVAIAARGTVGDVLAALAAMRVI